LSAAQATRTAEAIAGLGALLRTPTLRLPDTSLHAGGFATALDPTRVLPNLTKPHVAAVLMLPLFDEATYGRVRTHHRTVTENLLLRTSTQDELLDTLVTIVHEGRLSGCVDETLRLATNKTTSSFVRSEAVRALASIGSDTHIETLLACIVDHEPEIDHRV